MIRRERTGTWKVSNFTAHIRKYHPDLETTPEHESGKKKRHSDGITSNEPRSKMIRTVLPFEREHDDGDSECLEELQLAPSGESHPASNSDLCREDDQSSRRQVTVKQLKIEFYQPGEDQQWERRQLDG